MWYKGDDFKIRFSTRKSSSLIFSLIIRAMNSETQRPSEDTECDSVKRAGSDFDLGKHNVGGELENISYQGWTGRFISRTRPKIYRQGRGLESGGQGTYMREEAD